MRIGDFDIEITSVRIGGSWQAEGKMPDGKKVISAPKNSKEDAEKDVEHQCRSRLYPQRRYDVNRPFESLLEAEAFNIPGYMPGLSYHPVNHPFADKPRTCRKCGSPRVALPAYNGDWF